MFKGKSVPFVTTQPIKTAFKNVMRIHGSGDE